MARRRARSRKRWHRMRKPPNPVDFVIPIAICHTRGVHLCCTMVFATFQALTADKPFRPTISFSSLNKEYANDLSFMPVHAASLRARSVDKGGCVVAGNTSDGGTTEPLASLPSEQEMHDKRCATSGNPLHSLPSARIARHPLSCHCHLAVVGQEMRPSPQGQRVGD